MSGYTSTRFLQLSNENRLRRAMLLSRNGTKVNEFLLPSGTAAGKRAANSSASRLYRP